MKKLAALLSLVLVLGFALTGCRSKDADSILSDLQKNVEDVKGYHMIGDMDIHTGEDTHSYEVQVSYSHDDNYRVSLKNKMTEQEQIILKNEDGVFVLTPALNKSFKFQSEWPYNNSQAYLYQSIVNDIVADEERLFEEVEDGYMFKVKANYPNNPKITSQVIYLDKKLKPKEVRVLGENDVELISVVFTDIDMDAKFDESYFAHDENMNVARMHVQTETPTSTELNGIAYPLYVPENTYLVSEERADEGTSTRVILTFDGEKPFTVVQEVARGYETMQVHNVLGDPALLSYTVGAVNDISVMVVNDGIECYIVSDVMSKEELLQVAESLTQMIAK